MKKELTISGPTSKLAIFGAQVFILALFAAGFNGQSAFANAELDHRYALDSVGFLRSWDNVDGLFTDYVEGAYKDYFSRQSRFVVQDLSKVDDVLLHSKLGYQKAIEDKQVLAQLARTTHSQTLIRTHVMKEGPQYRFAMEWLEAPSMVPLAVEAMILKEPENGEALGTQEVQAQIEAALDRMIAKVPFKGHITGRDNNSVTLNIGATQGLKKGDTAIVSTLDEVRVHPLLGIIVDWRLTKTGKIEIDSVDEGISFGHVVSEEEGRTIARYQKITQIIPAPEDDKTEILSLDDERKKASLEMPKLGFVSGQLTPGSFSRDFNAADGTDSRTGGGVTFGAKLDAELWLTREFFGELSYGFNFWNQSQHPLGSSTATLNGGSSYTYFNLAGGYSYLVTGDFFGPKGWIKLGYQSNSYTLPADPSESSGPISFKGLYLGLGGDLPVRDDWGALLNFDIGLLNSVSESDAFNNGSASDSSNVAFTIGGYYRYTNRLTFRLSLDVTANSADFSNGNSVSQKVITVSPAVLYYF
jgi:hypothetical protein